MMITGSDFYRYADGDLNKWQITRDALVRHVNYSGHGKITAIDCNSDDEIYLVIDFPPDGATQISISDFKSDLVQSIIISDLLVKDKSITIPQRSAKPDHSSDSIDALRATEFKNHSALMAQKFDNDYRSTKDGWIAVKAWRKWRDINKIENGIESINDALKNKNINNKLHAALLACKGAYLRLNKRPIEAGLLAAKALKICPESEYAHRLMAAICRDNRDRDNADYHHKRADDIEKLSQQQK